MFDERRGVPDGGQSKPTDITGRRCFGTWASGPGHQDLGIGTWASEPGRVLQSGSGSARGARHDGGRCTGVVATKARPHAPRRARRCVWLDCTFHVDQRRRVTHCPSGVDGANPAAANGAASCSRDGRPAASSAVQHARASDQRVVLVMVKHSVSADKRGCACLTSIQAPGKRSAEMQAWSGSARVSRRSLSGSTSVNGQVDGAGISTWWSTVSASASAQRPARSILWRIEGAKASLGCRWMSIASARQVGASRDRGQAPAFRTCHGACRKTDRRPRSARRCLASRPGFVRRVAVGETAQQIGLALRPQQGVAFVAIGHWWPLPGRLDPDGGAARGLLRRRTACRPLTALSRTRSRRCP